MKNLKTISIKHSLNAIILVGIISLAACSNEKGNSKTVEEKTAPTVNIHEAAFLGNLEAAKGHIAAKTDLNVKDEYGTSPLGIATTFGKTEVAIVLIKGGADLNATSADGSTALHTAAFFGRQEIVKALLDAGANTNLRNNYGTTALESISAPFDNLKPIYDQISKDLGPFGLKLDYEQIQKTQPAIVGMLSGK